MPDESTTDNASLLQEAADLFNAAEYMQAHEVLDELWESTSGPSADFYKGLIQASIAMHHYKLDNVAGARKLYSGHRKYLAPYLPAHLGLNVEQFLSSMQSTLGAALRAAPGEEERYNAEGRPRMELE